MNKKKFLQSSIQNLCITKTTSTLVTIENNQNMEMLTNKKYNPQPKQNITSTRLLKQ